MTCLVHMKRTACTGSNTAAISSAHIAGRARTASTTRSTTVGHTTWIVACRLTLGRQRTLAQLLVLGLVAFEGVGSCNKQAHCIHTRVIAQLTHLTRPFDAHIARGIEVLSRRALHYLEAAIRCAVDVAARALLRIRQGECVTPRWCFLTPIYKYYARAT